MTTLVGLFCLQIWTGCTIVMITKITEKGDLFWGRIGKIIVSIILAPLTATMVILDSIDEIRG